MAHNVTKAQIDKLRREIEKVLPGIAEKLGLSIKTGRAHYGHAGDLMLKVAAVNEDGVVETPERLAWAGGARIRGLQQDLLDQTFTDRGRTFRVAGLKTRSPKMCVVCVCEDNGKQYVFDAYSVRRLTKTVCPDCGGDGRVIHCYSCEAH